jgi:phospholipid N-methyltransferase
MSKVAPPTRPHAPRPGKSVDVAAGDVPGEQKSRLTENFLFLGKFLRHGTKIASVWPSSPWLAKATIKEIDWDNARVVVELGAGTGPITDQIIRRLRPHTRFIAIERDADFVKILQRRFSGYKNVEIVASDVRDLDTVLKARGIKHVDAFVSGLPTPKLPRPVRNRMLASVRRYLVDGGVYSNITEIPFYYWNYYKKYFKQVSFDFVVKNMPPGGVYHCRACK